MQAEHTSVPRISFGSNRAKLIFFRFSLSQGGRRGGGNLGLASGAAYFTAKFVDISKSQCRADRRAMEPSSWIPVRRLERMTFT